MSSSRNSSGSAHVTGPTGKSDSYRKYRPTLSANFAVVESSVVTRILELEPKERSIVVSRLNNMFCHTKTVSPPKVVESGLVKVKVPPPEPNPRKVGFSETYAGRFLTQTSRLIERIASEQTSESRPNEKLAMGLYLLRRFGVYLSMAYKASREDIDPYLYQVFPDDGNLPQPRDIKSFALKILPMIALSSGETMSDQIKKLDFDQNMEFVKLMVAQLIELYDCPRSLVVRDMESLKAEAAEAHKNAIAKKTTTKGQARKRSKGARPAFRERTPGGDKEGRAGPSSKKRKADTTPEEVQDGNADLDEILDQSGETDYLSEIVGSQVHG